jgi:hypothetical protein
MSSRLIDYSFTRVIALVILGTDKNEIASKKILSIGWIKYNIDAWKIASAVLAEMRVK